MRYGPDHKRETRQRILDAAAVVFRREGFGAGSVDHVMAEAGLTAGGFYAHFASKEELFAEAFLQMLNSSRTLGAEAETSPGLDQVRAMANRYLSPAHRRLVERGCPMPPLLAELPRQNEATRRAFQGAIEALVTSMQAHFAAGKSAAGPSHQDMPDPLALLALLVGGISLARGVADAEFGDRILAACRQWIASSLEQNVAGEPKPSKKLKASKRPATKPESYKQSKTADDKKSRSSTPHKKGSLRS